ncbi:hypothetical protein WJX73_000987 [Symbiochloris irregularis]|uniref:Pre-mRNA-processing factor 19 n=1 Tax=Symbiochloris irregularis TaxID=706552 RepID=A0AAW1NT94_9CHLO
MSMFCAISGHVPEEPVVSRSTGHLYEKRLIEKYIQDNGKDPITQEALALDDLLPLKTNKAVKARPSPATSIPGMLNLFQGEWDALMLEMHQIRQALSTARQELSFSLYMQDAATRVIARLVRERDLARHMAESAQQALEASPAAAHLANGKRPHDDVEMEDAKRTKAGITADVIQAMTDLSQQLLQTRKKRIVSPTLTPLEGVQGFRLLESHPLHKTTQGGIVAVDRAPDKPKLLATAGTDHAVHLFDRDTSRITHNLIGHSKKVTDVKFLKSSTSLVTSSADKTVRLWNLNSDMGTYQPTTFTDQAADVTAIAVHASRDYFITASLDKTWCFYDAATALCMQQVADPAVEAGFTAASLHPDGLILGTGTQDSLVRIWDVRFQKNRASFEGHKGAVTSLSFSENGYYLATAASDGVKLWDLRKLKSFRTLTPYETGTASAVQFDHSGLYLAVAGTEDTRVYGTKQDWALLTRVTDFPAKGAYSLRWGPEAACLKALRSSNNLVDAKPFSSLTEATPARRKICCQVSSVAGRAALLNSRADPGSVSFVSLPACPQAPDAPTGRC